MGAEGSWEPARAGGDPGQRSSSEAWLKGVHWLKEQTRKEARDWGALARAGGWIGWWVLISLGMENYLKILGREVAI